MPRVMAIQALLFPSVASAWIYPEHRDIGLAAYERLSPADREVVDRLWAEARPAFQGRLCENPDMGDQGLKPACIDFAAFAALSGDHSCSPKELVEKVLPSDWVLGVARVAAETKHQLATATTREQMLNRIATSNLALQSADPEYATRAGANNAHFLLPRTSDELRAYALSSVEEGAPLNALGLYAQYHLAALALAQRLAESTPPEQERASMVRDVLALEGYALHWLEDIYSAGHVVGTWGSDAWRKGTHDYYSEFGIDTRDWAGLPIIAFGDAYMKPADLERASGAVARSLHSLANALRPGDELASLAKGFGPGPSTVLALDSCRETSQPRAGGPPELGPRSQAQLERMPVPSRGEWDVHPPRFREELGLFIGVFGTIAGSASWGSQAISLDPGSAAGTTWTAGLAAGVRVGFGAEDITGSVGTGIAFLDVGLAMQSAQLGPCTGGEICTALGTTALFPRVPARTGLRVGLRLPFWLIPGDMLLLAPVLALTSPADLSSVAVDAASGGLIPYERSFRTGAGIFQVVLGREVDATFFGILTDVLVILPTGTAPDGSQQLGVADVQSVRLNFPVLEWTPFRTFATQVTFAAGLQLGFGVEIPLSSSLLVAAPGAPASANLGTVWSVFLRGQFDGRFFFGSREDLQPLTR
jgi:hypothetical protein